MSTNPFDGDFSNQASPTSRSNPSNTSSSSYRIKKHHQYTQQQQQQQQQHQRPATILEHQKQPINPSSTFQNNSNSNSQTEKDPIWEARGVEWPLVSTLNLPSSHFNKLYKKSKVAGNALGIILSYDGGRSFGGSGGGGGGTGSGNGGGKGVNSSSDKDLDHGSTKSGGGDSRNSSGGGVQGGGDGGGYYGALGGFMGKLIGTQTQNVIGDELLDDDTINTVRSLRPPRSHCIASANGWIMAAVESTPIIITSNVSKINQSSNNSTNSSNSNKNSNNAHNNIQLPPLRLLSRWNVRRGSSDNHSMDGGLIPLPPPVITSNKKSSSTSFSTSSSTEQLTASAAGRIMHVFVDPTGCHTILSAQNGEAYYVHTLSKNNVVRKLKGFGPNVDGSSGIVPGCAISELSKSNKSTGGGSSSESNSGIQMGLTAGSYITSIGWDRKRGTEGSTKKILLGTSFGEIYEYSLNASLSSSDGSSKGNNDDGQETSAVIGDDELPLLLVQLNAREKTYGRIRDNVPSSGGGAVSGLHFERLGGSSGGRSGVHDDKEDMIVLAVTSGANKQTRLHTYLSVPSSESNDSTSSSSSDRSIFHRVFSSNESTSRRSFIELPGSINHADLKTCGEGFAMRTETGIYYGTIDKSSSMAVPFSKGSSGVVDAGMLPYETSSLPVSIAITPHHFITLSETSEVRFIDRVAKKSIQKERVDALTMSQSAGALDDGLHGGGIGELIMDVRRPSQVWLWKSRSLVHISSTREDRDVWKFSLECCLGKSPASKMAASMRNRGHNSNDDKYLDADFDNAKALCTNNIQKAVVTAARAKYHLSHNRVELAAKYMAQCPPELMPFAETSIQLALPMLGIGGTSSKDKEARKCGDAGLISYLLHKMQYYKARNDNVACTMIGAWLVELYLHERERCASSDGQGKNSNMSPARSLGGNNVLLQQFLSSNAYNMDAQTILRILCSHDATATECATYAASSGDIGTAVNAALCVAEVKNGCLDALRVLSDSPIEQAEPFYYKHAFKLLCRAPMAASKSFLARFSHGLSAKKLLPAFMRYEKKRIEVKAAATQKKSDQQKSVMNGVDSVQIARSRNEVELSIGAQGHFDQSQSFVDDDKASVTYFEGAITLGCRSPAVYNYLVSLYVNMDDEIPLYNFISKHIPSTSSLPGMQPKQTSPLDMNYSLSTILQSGRHFRSAIKLYMGFGMRYRAVELAIKVDPVLAKELASESVERDEKKRLWLMIARNAAIEGESLGGKEVVSKVLSVLNECGPGVLSIEDVLKFLPDVAQIDQFKDEICDALTSYSSRIEDYLKEMSDCDQTCNALREEIRRLSDFTTTMCSEARCAFTGEIVAETNEPFYVFPSGYVALERALKNEVMPYLNEKQKSKVESIEKEIGDLRGKVNPSGSVVDSYFEKSETEYRLEALQSELDGLIAAECPLTGSVMVESIDRCFGDSKEDELYVASEDLMMEA